MYLINKKNLTVNQSLNLPFSGDNRILPMKIYTTYR